MRNFNKYIRPFIKQYKWFMLATVFLGFLTFLTASMLTFTSGFLITRAAEAPYNILMLYVPIVLVRAFGIARPVVRYMERLVGHNTVLKILADMRVRLYDALEPQALFIRSRFQTGDLVGTLADDIEHLQDAYIRTIFPTIVALFLFVFSVTSLAIFDPFFALWIAVCLAVIIVVYPLLSLYFLKKRQIQVKEKRNRLYKMFTDAVLGISDWMISGNKERFIFQFMKESRETNKIEKKLADWNHARTFQLQVISGLILIFVGIWAGFEALEGEILPAYIASFTLVTLPILEGLIPVSNAIEKIPAYQESLERLENIDQYNGTQGVVGSFEIATNPVIYFENVDYTYGSNKEPALKNINLTIRPGEKVALLGKSGAGKSTLLQLLIGAMKPDNGTVKIGDLSASRYGEQIYEVISVLNQKPYLFATTVENNIRLGNQEATREEIEDVIRQVKLDQYIHSLPKGLDTQMEESGQRFSGGERQRIALARILLKNTPIVVLDEPTVGLDPLTERDLLDTIFKTLEGKTVILITHHLMGMEKMDQIVFLDNGAISMHGNHRSLLKENERYRKLYRLDLGEI
ncbi:thiol reductant ABC exporter subunit CydC [Caldibacillus thermoamylovorans]|uniref:thiol reductant ABC exporter subunit CydC n=1 Tax=Caldibacillus thermoamylovorans TaxID=35841 RepID=UPI00203BC4E1|nr:thiol reductant ABC exporter subunit CydC [Caldibacillus thermoamylovorans]MCM3478026.1 thiol reductant ABC exporter subunit CydC [Caldibacillus thermoamylovorans]